MCYMKHMLWVACILCVFTNTGWTRSYDHEAFSALITQDPYRYSTLFHFTSVQGYEGTVKKSAFRIRTCYDLSNEHGWEATGVCRLASMGSFLTWAKQIDIHDTAYHPIGHISGVCLTLEKAQFHFYQLDENLNQVFVATAVMDRNRDTFTVLHPESQSYQPIALFQREFVPEGKDPWRMTVFQEDRVDMRLLKIFGVFLVDHQDAFYQKEDL